MRSVETVGVSDVELTEINVIAFVLSPLSVSMVNLFITPVSSRFFRCHLMADSENPISFAISTYDLRASACRICIIFWSTESNLLYISSLLLLGDKHVHSL